jgi:ankyrin repeat protein
MKHFIIIKYILILFVLAGCTDKQFKSEREDLVHAIDEGNIRQLKQLVEKGYDIDSPDLTGNKLTPIMWAIYFGRREEFSYLLGKGVNVNSRDKNGWTALIYAIHNRDENVDFVEALVKHGADINVRDYRGVSALSYAKAEPPAPKIANILQQVGAKE